MNLYLLRHGEAEPRAHNDPARQLTARGRREIEQIARQFAMRQLPLDRCFVSPYVRALQTAEYFIRHSGLAVPTEVNEALIPETRASVVLQFLSGQGAGNILLVSHNPLLSELNALLVDGSISHMHILDTGELVAVSLEVAGLGMGRTSFRLVPDRHSNLS